MRNLVVCSLLLTVAGLLTTPLMARDCSLSGNATLAETVEPTQEVYSKVRQELRVLDRRDSQTFGQYASWLERAAGRLENLPILGVDGRLIDFGLDSAQRLRNIALAYRDIGMVSSIYRTYYSSCSTYQGYWGYYFGWYCRSYRDHTARRVAARDATLFRVSQNSEIHAIMADLRICLTQDYQAEFR